MLETKWHWGLAALIGFAAGFGGQWTSAQVFSDKTEVHKTKRKQKTRPPAQDTTALSKRVDELEAQLSNLRRQQRTAQTLREYAKSLAEDEQAADAKKPKKMNPVIDAEDPGFSLAVRSVVDQVQWERDEERRVRRTQRRNDRAAAQTELLVGRLALSDEQSEAVAKLLSAQMAAFGNLRNPDNENGEQRPRTRSEWRQRVTQIRADTEAKLAEVLTPDQLEGYKQFVEEETRWGRRGRSAPGTAPSGAASRNQGSGASTGK